MKKIKLLSIFTILLGGLFLLSGCTEQNVEGTLEEIMEKVYADVYTNVPEDERPMLGTINVSTDMQDNIEYYIGTRDIGYTEILASEPMMGSIAHSVVLVRMKDGEDIETAKQKILDNVNPRKWVCVEVPEEDVIVKSKGNLIILIMVADTETREKIEKGFDEL